jgi:hypothetical protein
MFRQKQSVWIYAVKFIAASAGTLALDLECCDRFAWGQTSENQLMRGEQGATVDGTEGACPI